MATRLLSRNQTLKIYQKHSVKSLSALLRLFSSQNKRSSQSSEDTTHPTKVKSDPAGKWLNIRAGIFGPDDDRLPLPGDVGLGLNYKAVEDAKNNKEMELNVSMEMLSQDKQPSSESMCNEFSDVADVFRTTQEKFLDDIRDLQSKFVDFQNASDETDALSNNLECKIQQCPELLKSDIQALFPNLNFKKVPLLVITMCKYTTNDMSSWSLEVEVEREELFKKFIDSAKRICDELKFAGYWADFIDPTSGRPYKGAYTNATFFETDERYRQLGFVIEDLGCCKVISHRNWGTRIFVGALFTNAPFSCPELEEIILAHAKIDD